MRAVFLLSNRYVYSASDRESFHRSRNGCNCRSRGINQTRIRHKARTAEKIRQLKIHVRKLNSTSKLIMCLEMYRRVNELQSSVVELYEEDIILPIVTFVEFNFIGNFSHFVIHRYWKLFIFGSDKEYLVQIPGLGFSIQSVLRIVPKLNAETIMYEESANIYLWLIGDRYLYMKIFQFFSSQQPSSHFATKCHPKVFLLR